MRSPRYVYIHIVMLAMFSDPGGTTIPCHLRYFHIACCHNQDIGFHFNCTNEVQSLHTFALRLAFFLVYA